MRICYFYATRFDEAVDCLPFEAEQIYTGYSDHAYWQEFSSRWTGKEDLLVIEQDIAIRDDVVYELECCQEDWCIFPYKNFSAALTWDGQSIDHFGSGYLTRNLGCTRFSAALQRRISIQDMLDASPYTDKCLKCTKTLRCWCHIDFPVYDAFMASGMTDADRHLHMEVTNLKTGLEAPMNNNDSPLNNLPFGFWDL